MNRRYVTVLIRHVRERTGTPNDEVVGSSPRQERLASVSFGRNTDRLSKRHEATAKTNLKCLLTKQSELAALPAHEEPGVLSPFTPLYGYYLLRCHGAVIRAQRRLLFWNARHEK